MTGKNIPIPSENIGAVATALRTRIIYLQEHETAARKRQERNVVDAIRADIAALTWALDNITESPEVEIGGGH